MVAARDGAGRAKAPRRMALAAALFLAAIAMVPVSRALMARTGSERPEEALPTLLIAGVVALLVALAGLIVLLTAAGLEDRRAALGMPEGSIRAVIALMLILLFSIMAIFLYASIRFTAPDAFAAADDSASAASALKASEDIARQLLTTVGTLVVAIAAFYFGSNSVSSATHALTRETDRVAELERLAALHKAGAVTDAEFASFKATLLPDATATSSVAPAAAPLGEAQPAAG